MLLKKVEWSSLKFEVVKGTTGNKEISVLQIYTESERGEGISLELSTADALSGVAQLAEIQLRIVPK